MSRREEGQKYRYIIHGVPKNKQYTVEEARWCDRTQQFESEQVHTVGFNSMRQWLGYAPATLGDMRTTMWLYLPALIQTGNKSPLLLWNDNREIFAPFGIEKLRFFPQGTCQEQASQVIF